MIKNLDMPPVRRPIIMAIYDIEQLETALFSKVEVCIIANTDPIRLQPVIEPLSKVGEYITVNINSYNGLS